MTIDTTFKKIQKIVGDVPVILAGTGASIPHGIPGMPRLACYLQKELCAKNVSDASWVVISSRLDDGIDLESALTKVTPEPSENLIKDITTVTWKFITEFDLQCFYKLLLTGETIPLSKLFRTLAQSSKRNINIITTNYDRLIEYACDQAKLEIDDRFCGHYSRWTSSFSPKTQNIVNLLKVHGSLDYFKDSNGTVCSIPMQVTVPAGFVPDIVPPGSNKYRTVLQGVHRDFLHQADNFIKAATGFLCIGYGFNDEQIQANMLEEIKLGKPVIVVTKSISDSAASLLRNSSNNYVIIQEATDKVHKTEFIVNGEYVYTTEKYWSIDGFMNIIS